MVSKPILDPLKAPYYPCTKSKSVGLEGCIRKTPSHTYWLEIRLR